MKNGIDVLKGVNVVKKLPYFILIAFIGFFFSPFHQISTHVFFFYRVFFLFYKKSISRKSRLNDFHWKCVLLFCVVIL